MLISESQALAAGAHSKESNPYERLWFDTHQVAEILGQRKGFKTLCVELVGGQFVYPSEQGAVYDDAPECEEYGKIERVRIIRAVTAHCSKFPF